MIDPLCLDLQATPAHALLRLALADGSPVLSFVTKDPGRALCRHMYACPDLS